MFIIYLVIFMDSEIRKGAQGADESNSTKISNAPPTKFVGDKNWTKSFK